MFERICDLLFTAAVLATVYTSQGYADDRQHWYRCNTHTHTASFPDFEHVMLPQSMPLAGTKNMGISVLVIMHHEHLDAGRSSQ